MLDTDPLMEPAPAARLDPDDDLDDDDDVATQDLLDPTRVLGELPEIPPSLIELDKIPRRLWDQTLAPLHRQQRYWIARQVGDKRLQKIAMSLAYKLDMDECNRAEARSDARHHARRAGFPLPTPQHDHRATRPSVQVNVRLRADDHARLAQAAAAVGLKPTTLARALVLNGAARMLQEHATAS